MRIFNPQPSLYPRWQYSLEYGKVLFKSCIMEHKGPGKWKFTYTINECGYRGKKIPISNSYEKSNIVILGDSYSFGTGVDDGEEFPAVMHNYLIDNYDIINLSVGGYGLTQEIRRYYEFGQLYQPQIVILQFASNDLEDNYWSMVTKIENGRFVFYTSNNSVDWVKQYLSKSIIQKSQLYNFFRHSAYLYLRKRYLRSPKEKGIASGISPHEDFHNSLLELFAKDLKRKGIGLILISVNGENHGQIMNFPFIKQKVSELDSNGFLEYIEVAPWFKNVEDYGSPEGHSWGQKAHAILGYKLAEFIKERQ